MAGINGDGTINSSGKDQLNAPAFLWWDGGSIFFECITELGIDTSSAVTDYPVENGVNVADHVQRELDKVTLEALVSNTPIYDLNGRGGKVTKLPLNITNYRAPLAPTPGAVFSAIGNTLKDAVGSLLGGKSETSAQVLQWPTPFDAPADMFDVLSQLQNSVQLVNISTRERLFENMYLESMNVTGNAGTGTSRTFKLSFKEIRKVQVRIVNAPIPTEVRARTKVSKGVQGPKEVPKGSQNESVLYATGSEVAGRFSAATRARLEAAAEAAAKLFTGG